MIKTVGILCSVANSDSLKSILGIFQLLKSGNTEQLFVYNFCCSPPSPEKNSSVSVSPTFSVSAVTVSGEVGAEMIGDELDVDETTFSVDVEEVFEVISAFTDEGLVTEFLVEIEFGRAESQDILGMLELWAENPLKKKLKN